MVYDSLAPFYDTIMSHVDYRIWLSLIRKIATRYGISKNARLLEIGGGTGSLASLLKKEGYRLDAFDRSFGMCAAASEKKIPFFCADALHIPLKTHYDLAFFLYDGINYLTSPEDYKSLFSEVHARLSPNGLFLFDITTRFNSVNNFKNVYDFEDHDHFSYIRHSYFNETKSTQHNNFTIFIKNSDNLYAKRNDHHSQLVLSAERISSFISPTLFSIEGIWDDFSFNHHTEESERIHFLLKRK